MQRAKVLRNLNQLVVKNVLSRKIYFSSFVDIWMTFVPFSSGFEHVYA